MLRLSSLQCGSNTCAVVRDSSSATASLTGCRHHHQNHRGQLQASVSQSLVCGDSIGWHNFNETLEYTSTIIGFIHRHSFNEAVEYRNLIAKVRASEEVPVILGELWPVLKCILRVSHTVRNGLEQCQGIVSCILCAACC